MKRGKQHYCQSELTLFSRHDGGNSRQRSLPIGIDGSNACFIRHVVGFCAHQNSVWTDGNQTFLNVWYRLADSFWAHLTLHKPVYAMNSILLSNDGLSDMRFWNTTTTNNVLFSFMCYFSKLEHIAHHKEQKHSQKKLTHMQSIE